MNLKTLRNLVNARTFIHYFLLLTLVIRSTISDKHQQKLNRPKKHFQDNVDSQGEYPQHQSSCSSCKMREEIKIRNIEMIKGEILRRMGFQQAPNITGKELPQIPSRYLAMVESEHGMQSDQPLFKTGFTITEEEDDYVKTQTILTFAQPYPRLRHKGHDILHFTFSDSITKFRVSNATLNVYIKGGDRRPLPDVFIEVFKVKKITEHPDPPGFSKIYSRKITQPYITGDWVRIDLSETVSEWFKNPKDNHGFVVNATVNGRKVVVTDPNFDNGDKAPFVEISTVEPKRRVRRNLGLNCDDKVTEPLCCRYPLIVDFEEIGFDFIIAPKKYDAHMCSGDCPFVTLQRYPHTHLVTMSSPQSAQPCCAPKKMSAISMLYFDEHLTVVYGSLPGMVVDRCGCS